VDVILLWGFKRGSEACNTWWLIAGVDRGIKVLYAHGSPQTLCRSSQVPILSPNIDTLFVSCVCAQVHSRPPLERESKNRALWRVVRYRAGQAKRSFTGREQEFAGSALATGLGAMRTDDGGEMNFRSAD